MTNSTSLLKFGIGNANLGKAIHTFTLPSGYTCPGALACMTKADRKTGTITDGKAQTFCCFAASMEARLTPLRAKGWHNLELLKKHNTEQLATDLIQASLPSSATIVRIHVGGDFFSGLLPRVALRCSGQSGREILCLHQKPAVLDCTAQFDSRQL